MGISGQVASSRVATTANAARTTNDCQPAAIESKRLPEELVSLANFRVGFLWNFKKRRIAFGARYGTSARRIRGTQTVNVVPSSAVEVTEIVPPLARTISRTMYKPSPILPGVRCSADSRVE